MTATPAPTFRPLSLLELESIRDISPDLYTVLTRLGEQFNAFQADYVARNTEPAVDGTGPSSVAVQALGATNLVTWTPDECGKTVVSYEIWWEPGGTRNAPTSPSFLSAIRITTVPATDGCANGSGFAYPDKDFQVSTFDPANPGRDFYWVRSVYADGSVSLAIGAGSSSVFFPSTTPAAVETVPEAPAEISPEIQPTGLNKFFNAGFVSSATTVAVPLPQQLTIVQATATTPIRIATSGAHGLATGEWVFQRFNDKAEANGVFQITVIDASHYDLVGSVSAGPLVGTSGVAVAFTGQPRSTQPNWTKNSVALAFLGNSPPFSPWYVNGNAFTGGPVGSFVPRFISDGSSQTGEIQLTSTAAFGGGASSFSAFGCVIFSTKFRKGMHLTFSVYLRSPAPTSNQISLAVAGVGTPSGTQWSGSLLRTTYRRFTYNFTIDAGFSPPSSNYVFLSIGARNFVGTDVYAYKPMLAVGDVAPQWVSTVDDADVPGTFLATSDSQTPNLSLTIDQQIARDANTIYA